ncbi:MAG: 50S ribosomal protein L18 [Candidatus Thermoplasmatota archaeon]|jgi:large subunit ribosomal protein L18|nr:50S ribosomal protein L18 [Candidatus Thermoplasmatota archaeon]
MTHGPRYKIKTRRRREGKTDYRKRLALLKSRKTRIVVRKTIKNTQVQFVEYNEIGDKVLVSAMSKELASKYNWKYSTSTTPAAYLTGLLAGKRAVDKGIKEGVLDIGRYTPATGSKVFAALKGVLDAGIECSFNEEKIPSDERLFGKHLNKEIEPSVKDIKDKIIGGK